MALMIASMPIFFVFTISSAWLISPISTLSCTIIGPESIPSSTKKTETPVSVSLFFNTQKGLISFGGNATKPASNFSQIEIYPNPVYPQYSGEVGLRGLINDSRIKIANAKGSLVNLIESNGGMASWDTKDLNGVNVDTGVYFFFISDEGGSETFVGKILIIR